MLFQGRLVLVVTMPHVNIHGQGVCSCSVWVAGTTSLCGGGRNGRRQDGLRTGPDVNFLFSKKDI